MEMFRLDALLVKLYPNKSRSKLQALIKQGKVEVNGVCVTKTGCLVKEDDDISIIEEEKYVSRGGYKLEKAIEEFKLDFKNKTVLDIGASTGGFTDCSLKYGAKEVYAIDVGINQLDDKLKKDKRVKSIEKMNFRYIKSEDLDNKVFDIVVIDVSFISLKPIFDNLHSFITSNSIIVALIKPQFEAGKDFVNKNGKVKSEVGQLTAIQNAIKEANDNKLFLNKIIVSPIKGNKSGNTEYLGLFSKIDSHENINIEELIKGGH